MTVAEILKDAAPLLESAGIPEYLRESISLLQFALNKDRVFIVAYPEYELSAAELERYRDALDRRAAREPLQYITGRQEFYGLDFRVTPDVLIPRPETEMLVESAIGLLRDLDAPRFAEIGVGSGCISVSILHHVANARAVGGDISMRAIEAARKNAELCGVSERLELMESDIFAGFVARRFDLVVSNPPYIRADDIAGLEPEVRSFEPLSALTDGGDGLSIVNGIILEAAEFLHPGGYLIMEIGFGQAERVRRKFDGPDWADVEILPDFQQIPRMVVARSV